jgi:mRNA interferase MazF
MPSRGQIYFASLDPIQGREQSGRRPVLVVSNDAINRQPLVVAVIVGTDAANIQRDYPTNIRVTAAESGLPRDTLFLAFQLRSLDHSRFTGPAAGCLSPMRMAEVADALRLTLDLFDSDPPIQPRHVPYNQ